MKPCDKCPWLVKNNPAITQEVKDAAKQGAWFCCHTRMGTCTGVIRK